MLDLAVVLSLAQQCAPQVAPQTLAAIAWTESRFDPLAIGVNSGSRRSGRYSTRAESASAAERLIAAGANVDLGLAQINSENLEWLGLTVPEAFDPCRNLAAAAAVLEAGYRPMSPRADHRQAALRVALSLYNTGDRSRGFRNGYVAKVERAAADLGLSPLQPLENSPSPDLAPEPVDLTDIPSDPEAAPQPQPQPQPQPWDVFARTRSAAWMTFSQTTSHPALRSIP